jgi:C4-dicarboxylate-specific signal transduction histidine kinase
VLFSALLIHIDGGRIEMHFHIFGSLAFLAFYRDWRVLITASAVVAAHHLAGVIYVPESVYGLESVSGWRWVEHAGWVIFEDIFLILSCRQSVGEMADIARRQAMLEQSHRTVEQKVEERTRELRTAQDDLVKVARSMGMAEIATSVLHNVGNVLNSVNVSVELATTKMRQFPLEDFARVVTMMRDHSADLGTFIEKDQRGSHIPSFLATLSEILSEEQRGLLAEMASLAQNVEHIKQIINVQQTHAKLGRTAVDVNLPHAIEDALQVTLGAIKSGLIDVRRELSGPEILVGDKHALLQILINLFSNAKHALLAGRPTNPVITIRTMGYRQSDRDWIRIEVHDNGAGIPKENLTRIFNHGFTTKSNGHGFGLHASANSAKQMGGTLGVASEGPGMGATFTLEFPVKAEALTV